jgi:large subunit ribosomal protein L20
MPKSVNHVASRRRRKKILKLAKGYFGRKKNVWTVAKNQVEKGWLYAYRDRRNKKREFRKLWIQRINAGARLHGYSYSRLMGALKVAGVDLNRKVLADLAMNHPEAFAAVVEMAKAGAPKQRISPDHKVKEVAPKAKKAPAKEVPAETPTAEVATEPEPTEEAPAS